MKVFVNTNIFLFVQRYMSPEVAEHKPYNQGADVYSFGIVLHEIHFLSCPIPRKESGLIDKTR